METMQKPITQKKSSVGKEYITRGDMERMGKETQDKFVKDFAAVLGTGLALLIGTMIFNLVSHSGHVEQKGGTHLADTQKK